MKPDLRDRFRAVVPLVELVLAVALIVFVIKAFDWGGL